MGEPVDVLMAKREAQFERKAMQLSIPKLIALLDSPHAYKRAVSAAELATLVEDVDSGAAVAAQVFSTGTVHLLRILGQAGYENVRENACKLLAALVLRHSEARMPLIRAGCIHLALPMLQVPNVTLRCVAKRLLLNLCPQAFKVACSGPLATVVNPDASGAMQLLQKGNKSPHENLKDYAPEVSQLMHAYGDSAAPVPASVFLLCGIVRRWINHVYNGSVENIRRTRKTAGKGWREHTGVSVDDIAGLLPDIARRYRYNKQMRSSGSLEDDSTHPPANVSAVVPSG